MRLIDADSLEPYYRLMQDNATGMNMMALPDGVVDQQPTVDAVPVIRCKDCKHYERDHFDAVYYPTESGEAQKVPLITAHEICTKWGDGCKTAEDGYCFLGERKEE